MPSSHIETHAHGPANAEHELLKAYNCVVESGVTFFNGSQPIEGINPDEVLDFYRRAFNAHRKEDGLAAERWARTTKHLARAFWHEAKIAFLEPKTAEIPFITGARDEFTTEQTETAKDLLDSVAMTPPPGYTQMPEELTRFVNRGREHLAALENADYRNELLRAERLNAAHEYGRVVECMALALEAEKRSKKAA